MRNEEKTLRSHYIIIRHLFFIGIFVMLSTVFFVTNRFFWIPFVLGYLLMVSGALYQHKYFKCPHCGAKLTTRMKMPNFCPNCGKKLQ